MNAVELSAHIKKKAELVNKMACSHNGTLGMGFAIPIPQGTEEKAIKDVDVELRLLMWSFQRLKIQGQEYYVLFP